jgi:alkylhydroperoxidase family enzyme
MRLRDARKAGESPERLDLISARHEAPVFSTRERAALAWTEAVTLVADTHAPDAAYETAREAFSEQELVELTMAAVTINGWNRLMAAFRISPRSPEAAPFAEPPGRSRPAVAPVASPRVVVRE